MKNRNLLIIDDDKNFCEMVAEYFKGKISNTFISISGKKGLEIFKKEKIDIVLLDQKLPDSDGIEICRKLLSHTDQIKIILITAYPKFNIAVKAIKLGAYDYISKPFEIEELELTIKNAIESIDYEKTKIVQDYKNLIDKQHTVLIGNNKRFNEIKRMIRLSAENSAPVLITGETGTGKGVVAKTIYYKDLKNSSSFININCGALPESLIESELFGYEKGAFTGAYTNKKGLFEMAEGGILFLDEIGELPYHLQSKLLGVLDEKKTKRLGSNIEKKINTRIIAATNIDIEKAVEENKFRQDLYFRLSVLRIHLPPLRERVDDIEEITNYFIKDLAFKLNVEIEKEEIEKLKTYYWPGNIRELKNIIERAIILRQGNKIYPSKLLKISSSKKINNSIEKKDISTLGDIEKKHIKFTIDFFNNNHTKAAKTLGISRSTLIRKLKSF